MSFESITLERRDGIALLMLNRPERLNAINGQLRRELNEAWLTFRDDTDAWVAIVTGAGRAFCAGADLRDGAEQHAQCRTQGRT